jgi:hypothetical protein
MALQCNISRWCRALYCDGDFFAQPDYCESYGKDVVTCEPVTPDAYRRKNPTGKAMIKPASYLPATEAPSAEFPYALASRRTVYHFHTRTKTASTPERKRLEPSSFRPPHQMCGWRSRRQTPIANPSERATFWRYRRRAE